MKKKLLSIILALCMVVGMLPVTAFAASATNYTITKAATENGSFTVKVGENEATEAAEGAEVVVTATANKGYEVKSIEVKDADDGEVTVKDGKFTMPGKNVTVTVTFQKVAADVTLASLTVTNKNGGTTLTLDPTFHKDTTTYTLDVESNVESVTISATPAAANDVDLSYKIAGKTAQASELTNIALTAGADKAVEITVTDEADSSNTKTYIVNIHREKTATGKLAYSQEKVASVKGVAKVTVTGESGKFYLMRTLMSGKASLISVPADASGKVIFAMPIGTNVQVSEVSQELSFKTDGSLDGFTGKLVKITVDGTSSDAAQ